MYGYGRGWHRGRGFWRTNLETPEGYIYIGPCRCGFGPDAYYQEKRSGRIVHARDLFSSGLLQRIEDQQLLSEISKLREEKERLEKKIGELEKILKEGGRNENSNRF